MTGMAKGKQKNQFITKSGKTYYLNEKGKKVKGKFITVKKRKYYMDKNGVRVQGWKQIGKNFYYFDREKGSMRTNCTVDGIKIKKNGKYIICGDNRVNFEYDITEAEVVGVLAGYMRGDEYVALDDEKYLKYVKSLGRKYPIRYIKNFLFRLKRKLGM